jgi:hypothetical protein
MLSSNFGQETNYPEAFHVFPQSPQMPGQYLKLGNSCFLPNTSLTNHFTIQCQAVNAITDTVVKQSRNNNNEKLSPLSENVSKVPNVYVQNLQLTSFEAISVFSRFIPLNIHNFKEKSFIFEHEKQPFPCSI